MVKKGHLSKMSALCFKKSSLVIVPALFLKYNKCLSSVRSFVASRCLRPHHVDHCEGNNVALCIQVVSDIAIRAIVQVAACVSADCLGSLSPSQDKVVGVPYHICSLQCNIPKDDVIATSTREAGIAKSGLIVKRTIVDIVARDCNSGSLDAEGQGRQSHVAGEGIRAMLLGHRALDIRPIVICDRIRKL